MGSQPQNFNHPYSPYDIQLQFMRALYTCLEEGKVAVFESPTGTGKSLSLICGSMTWLREHKRKALQDTVNKASCSAGDDDGEPEWMLEFAKRESARAVTEKRRALEARLEKIKVEEEKQRHAHATDHPGEARKRQRLDTSSGDPGQEQDDQFILDDYDSDAEERITYSKKLGDISGLSTSTLELLERFKEQFSASAEDETGHEDDDVKIFYCSRTHSQLSQFSSELRRVKMPSSMPAELSTSDANTDDAEERVKHLTLGSRKNLCINPKVMSLGNATAINERCLELQQPGVAAEKRCPYLPSKEDEGQVLQFRDHTLATIKDIEDMGKLGKRMGICPYYASRSVLKHSEIVTLPYPLLLQRSARDALDLSIKNHVVIIDEAHNLMDAICNIHSVTITLSQLQTALSQLTTYARKHKARLKGKNRSYIAQIIRLISSIADHLRSTIGENLPAEGAVDPSDLMAGKGVDQINPYKLSRYLQESKLARKVDGYVEFSKDKNQQSDDKPSSPVLFLVQSFLLPLMNPSAEGRFFYLKFHDDIQLKYMLLDPTNHFREIVEDARAVILAGGTMSPMSDYRNHLFSYIAPSRLDTFSYGHVIPPENLIAHTLVNGVLGSEFDFTYDSRDSEKMILDLGRTVAMLCQAIPDGVVAFFPSYDYLSRILAIWRKPLVGEKGQTILSLIERKKSILYEGRDMGAKTEDLLQEYTRTIDSGQGALLLSVVGGKLSEGINFSDKLGRGVLIIGLPFPNIRSAVWQAKIQYVEQKTYNSSSGSEKDRLSIAKAAGKDFYENACMRAVNQCIGRAIRHRNDYAAIVMIDRRYEKANIQGKLPAWIKQSMLRRSVRRPASALAADLSNFFSGRSSG
ncbi:DNA helicase [Aspergillus fischeri NRRL 181]|uniref:ATP-dependent DNA helicase chl1 n=1 Tax=Neosartorya fischeri (strain ATCC 1020 / DSM 3700 / CBS 544.65 / FGSC A1164 / JCM 1740 / NRRL 181 / WB 181) TaxID=331117 RepID=CHL1_NEOFI|nr:DEAD_2 domain protein [Aspergillus fischeri NRRL 181]A1D8E4.1 RecName: Full=ATP-dependent DNA helicase chl1; AltName: Full=Chromosome loss protein 1 [Aspergillus fischeri NRRL 181]EAW21988.1 DEAD_2 domain protein [Aspergillus fischeri NRRL 181]